MDACNCSICNQSEEETAFWGSVQYYMEVEGLSKEEAISKAYKD